jgi:hypothetical protein
MEARLIVVGGKANRSEVKLKLPAMLGRGRDVDITVAHATVSRHHCLIYELDGALVVRDNGSLNGTMVDGRRIKEALLRPGQSLSIGPLTFRAEYEHNGSFPVLGAPPGGQAADAAGEEASRAPAVDTTGKSHPGEQVSIPMPGAAKRAADDSGFLDEEPKKGKSKNKQSKDKAADSPGFDFLNDDDESASVDRADSFNFLDEEPASPPAKKPLAASGDSDDEVFRFADEPQSEKKDSGKGKKAKQHATSPSANGDHARSVGANVPAAGTAKGSAGKDAGLDDFLDSLGLDE